MTYGRRRTELGARRLALIDALAVGGEQHVRFAFAGMLERYTAFSRAYERGWDTVPVAIQDVVNGWTTAWWSAVPGGSIDSIHWKQQLANLDMEPEMPVGLLMVWTRSGQVLDENTTLFQDLSDLALDLSDAVVGSLTHRLPAARRDLWYSGMSAAERESEMLNVWGRHPASLLVLEQLGADLSSVPGDLVNAVEDARAQGRRLANLTSRLDSVEVPDDGPLQEPFWASMS